MPMKPARPCTACGVLVHDGTGRCEKHKVREGTFADERRGSRHERGYGSAWDKIRVRILKRDHGLCQCSECKRLDRIRVAHHVDHIISKAEWRRRHGNLVGVDDDDNLQAINRDCHAEKTARERVAARR